MAGNANSGKRKEKKFYNALNLAISDGTDNPVRLRNIAEKLLKSAEDGEQWAIKEVADRLDGKAAQQHTISGDDEGGPVRHVFNYYPAPMGGDDSGTDT